MHENVPKFGYNASPMYYFNNSQLLLASLTQEKCPVTQNSVLNYKSQQTVKLKHFESQNKLARVIMSHIQTNNEAISNRYFHRKLADKLSIWFSYFQSSSCSMHVKQQAVQEQCTFLLSLKQTIGLY